MTLPGVTPFPLEFAVRYRARGYWEDRPLIAHFLEAFDRYGDRVAVIDEDGSWTYSELASLSERVALNLLDLGVRPSDRVVVQLPNNRLFASFYFALQRIGAIPVMALPSHRYRELRQFAGLSGAVAAAAPATARDADFAELHRRVRAGHPHLRLSILQGAADAGEGCVSLEDLHERRATRHRPADLGQITAGIDPCDPAVFQLSGGTTGIPKLIPRTHNDYAFNSKLALSVCDVDEGDVLLNVLPIAHNLPLACPGLQGFLLSGATVCLSRSAKGPAVFAAIDRHRVTHIHAVPALLIQWINDPAAAGYDLGSVRVVQSGGQRLQPETRLRTERIFRNVIVQENFGMAEGLLMFVRLDDPPQVRLETVGRPICADDEVRLVGEDGTDVPDGEIGEMWARGPYTLRGYYNASQHNQRAFSPDGFYRSGDLMWRHRTARTEQEVVADFREHGIEAVLVAFDIESVTGAPPCTSAYVAGLRDRYPDTFVQAWGTVDPLLGHQAIEEAQHAVAEHRVLGFHFHPIMGRYSVADPQFAPLFDAINALGVPVMIDVGTTGMGAGMPGGDGARIRHAHPQAIDELAAAFPGLPVIAAHPGWPWVEEMTAVALHKGNVYWQLSGWAPKHFPASLRIDVRGRLQDKIMFGSDYPSLPLDRLLLEWDGLGFSDEVMHKVCHANAERILGLPARVAGPQARAQGTGVGMAGEGP